MLKLRIYLRKLFKKLKEIVEKEQADDGEL